MLIDILCPGETGDSYESRMLGESVWNAEVCGIHGLLLLCKSYFESEQGKFEQELFHEFPIYNDGHLIGDYSKGIVTLYPPMELVHVNGTIGFRLTTAITRDIEFPVDLCINYGINKRTIRFGNKRKYVWL